MGFLGLAWCLDFFLKQLLFSNQELSHKDQYVGHTRLTKPARAFSSLPLMPTNPALWPLWAFIWVWDSGVSHEFAFLKPWGSVTFFLGFILSYSGMNQKTMERAGGSRSWSSSSSLLIGRWAKGRRRDRMRGREEGQVYLWKLRKKPQGNWPRWALG